MQTKDMLTKVRKTIKKHDMLRKGDHVLVGVSGGADSVALLAALNHLRPAWRLTLTAAHFNHKTRAAESDRDEAFVRTLCQSIGIAVVCGSLKEGTRPCGLSIEDFLRRSRYGFFEKMRRKAGANRIALGHHQGDQSETVLMNVIRGAGLAGISGMPPVRNAGTIIRPLIDCPRREILDYLASVGLSFVDDSSNTDERFLRNRIRAHLMPELQKSYNPAIHETLCRLADVLRTENDYMTREAHLRLTRWRDGRKQENPLEVPIAELKMPPSGSNMSRPCWLWRAAQTPEARWICREGSWSRESTECLNFARSRGPEGGPVKAWHRETRQKHSATKSPFRARSESRASG
jgi:tRNA(Ile)-lysidine synthase